GPPQDRRPRPDPVPGRAPWYATARSGLGEAALLRRGCHALPARALTRRWFASPNDSFDPTPLRTPVGRPRYPQCNARSAGGSLRAEAAVCDLPWSWRAQADRRGADSTVPAI